MEELNAIAFWQTQSPGCDSTGHDSTGSEAFLYPTSFASRLRWEYSRFEAKHPLSKNH
ncbi:protein containing DUF1560 [Rhodopirellula baltica SH28]|uniref:Protein containing DUF1560 n=1 Tax=Rhodopirellula baltica SH28 TaxID=993517 RepID=K5E602_RHOBT|nr:protein containing DUF1560 [Rhodopirellula baltica SH28]